MEMTAEMGRGYNNAEKNKKTDQALGVLPIDSIYTPVKNGPKRDIDAIEKFYGSDFYKNIVNNPKIDIYDEWDDENIHKVGHDI